MALSVGLRRPAGAIYQQQKRAATELGLFRGQSVHSFRSGRNTAMSVVGRDLTCMVGGRMAAGWLAPSRPPPSRLASVLPAHPETARRPAPRASPGPVAPWLRPRSGLSGSASRGVARPIGELVFFWSRNCAARPPPRPVGIPPAPKGARVSLFGDVARLFNRPSSFRRGDRSYIR